MSPKTTLRALMIPSLILALGIANSSNADEKFHVEEATIESIQHAITSGQMSCKQIVQAYVERAKAYNGVCTALVTPDGANIKSVKGYIRAGKALNFPTQTVKASTVFPELDQYKGIPLDYGRMETTVSDPTAFAQMGMRVGMPDVGQVNALETLNIRG